MAYLIVFAAMFAFDFVFAYYTKAIQRRSAFAAANWAVAITVFSAVAQIGYVEDHWLLVPATAGAFAGTYAAVKVWRESVLDSARSAGLHREHGD